jgi:soluble lytic murein transglycosylase-like protein
MRTLHSSCVLLLCLLGTGAQAQPPIRLITATRPSLTASLIARAAPHRPARFASALAIAGQAGSAAFLQGTVWDTVAGRYGLDPLLLYGVALQETRHRAGPAAAAPWPYTLRGPDGPQFHRSQEDAARALQRLLARHRPLAIDVGLMQINLHWHGDRVAHPEQLLDPQTNLDLAARILTEAIRSAPGDPELGIGRYHQWQDATVARAYGRRVHKLARALSIGQ